ncbi:MAG: hypothetical protein ACKO38_19000 [Planctomycetota bacterium]
MTIADDLWKLDELRRNGSISHEEFELAKRLALDGPQDASRSEQLEELKVQNEIAQLDREWEMERKNYMVEGRNGSRYLPGKASSVIGGVIVVAFGIFWTVTSAFLNGFGRPDFSGFFPWFGVVFTLFGVSVSIHAFMKAGRYEEARQRYQRCRRELQDRKRTIA